MTTSLRLTFGIALSIFTVTSASAGEPLPRAAINMSGFPAYGSGYGYWNGTTAHESLNCGRATLIRSIGERNLLDAEARRSNEEAVSRRLDNALKAHETRLTRKRIGMAEQSARHAVIQARRNTQMAINDADRILRSPSTANRETHAEARLRLAKSLLENSRQEHAVNRLEEVRTNYPNTAAAYEAAEILNGLGT